MGLPGGLPPSATNATALLFILNIVGGVKRSPRVSNCVGDLLIPPTNDIN